MAVIPHIGMPGQGTGTDVTLPMGTGDEVGGYPGACKVVFPPARVVKRMAESCWVSMGMLPARHSRRRGRVISCGAISTA